MFFLVLAHPGSPGQRTVKQLLLLLSSSPNIEILHNCSALGSSGPDQVKLTYWTPMEDNRTFPQIDGYGILKPN